MASHTRTKLKVLTCAGGALRTADGLPDNLGESQSKFWRGNAVHPYCVRDGLRSRQRLRLLCYCNRATFWGHILVTSGALAIQYDGPIERIPVISSLTYAFRTEPEHSSFIIFKPSLPPLLLTVGLLSCEVSSICSLMAKSALLFHNSIAR